MTVTYSAAVKTARMTAVRDQIDAGGAAGRLELCSAAYAAVLATILLGYSGASTGTVAGSVLTLAGFPRSDSSADAGGKPVLARVRTSGGADVITGLTVGLSATAAPAWAGSTTYVAGQYRTNGANQYKCVVGGVSAASGGPAGTGAGIADGAVTWDYYSPAGADVQLDSLEITAGQTVTINSAAFTHA